MDDIDYIASMEAALSARDARIAELERHLAACKAECRAWRLHRFNLRHAMGDVEALTDSKQAVEASVAATDAAGGVS